MGQPLMISIFARTGTGLLSLMGSRNIVIILFH